MNLQQALDDFDTRMACKYSTYVRTYIVISPSRERIIEVYVRAEGVMMPIIFQTQEDAINWFLDPGNETKVFEY